MFKNSFEQIVQQNQSEVGDKRKKFFNTRVNLELENKDHDCMVNVGDKCLDDDGGQFSYMKDR